MLHSCAHVTLNKLIQLIHCKFSTIYGARNPLNNEEMHKTNQICCTAHLRVNAGKIHHCLQTLPLGTISNIWGNFTTSKHPSQLKHFCKISTLNEAKRGSKFSTSCYSDLREEAWLRSAGFNDVLDFFELRMLFIRHELQEDRLAGGDDDAGTCEPLRDRHSSFY